MPKQNKGQSVRFEMRCEPEVYDRLRSLSENAGVSINQIVQGLLRWGVDHANVGKPVVDIGGARGFEVKTKPVAGCLWFGSSWVQPMDGSKISKEIGAIFSLDFSAGRAVREDEGKVVKGKKS